MQTQRSTLIGLIWIGFTTLVTAQNYYPQKDAAFAQVVVGEGFETIINLTNSGDFSYTGTLFLFREDNQIWNPMVNGTTLVNGEFPIEIQPRKTVTLRLTGSKVESGAAVLLSQDLLLDNFIEANLSYLRHVHQKVTNSVGVFPSKEFYLTSIPFTDFKAVGLALVNGDLSGECTARIELKLFSGEGDLVDTKIVELGSFFHSAKFLWELFPGHTLEGGKVQIASDQPVFGTALTLTDQQFSSLPLIPSPVSYSIGMIPTEGAIASGELTLWAEGFFIQGYLLISALDGELLDESIFALVNGQLVDGFLRLSFSMHRDPFFSEEATLYLEHDRFSFDSTRLESTWLQLFLSDGSTMGGNYELTRNE